MSTPTVVGHTLCVTCEAQWVSREIARWTNGNCDGCFIALGCQRRSRVEVLSRGNRLSIPKAPGRTRAHRPNRTTKIKSKQAEKAKERARATLARLFPELYFELVADERSRAGLPPWTVPMALRAGGPEFAERTLAFAEQLEAER